MTDVTTPKPPRSQDALLGILLGAALLCAALILSPSCKTGSSVPPVVSEGVSTGIDCAKDSIANIAKDHLLDIESTLLRDNWQDALKSDALKLGSDVVSCLVEYVVTRSRQDQVRASSDRNTMIKISRGDEWLKVQNPRFAKTLQ